MGKEPGRTDGRTREEENKTRDETAFWPFAQPSHFLLPSRSHGWVSFKLHAGFGGQFDPTLLCVLGGMVAFLVLMSGKLALPVLGFNFSGPGCYLSDL